MLPKGAACLLLPLVLSLVAVIEAESRFYYRHHGQLQNRRSYDTSLSSSQSSLPSTASSSSSSTNFDPDVLNRFLEEYANKIKKTTERTRLSDEIKQKPESPLTTEVTRNRDVEATLQAETTTLNDTTKRQKYYSSSSSGDERNNGWVTLDAIPWSKSKISKWQANPTSQRPWPDQNVGPNSWDKPSYSSGKPAVWNTDYPPRPSIYESQKPWPTKVTKPHWADNSAQNINKPWYSESQRPGYVDKYEENPNQAQKWPPERPSWDRYPDNSRPSSDIITDNGPTNFPTNHWDRPGSRPTYSHQTETYVSEPNGWHDRNDFPSYNKYPRPSHDDYYDRPHFSHYQYPSSGSEQHPSNYPTAGDGHWVLLSTNRGYSKSRQRSLKLDKIAEANEAEKKKYAASGSEEEHVPAVTSKRQVRLTVLPSINGTNTTTSHGGLLEVEKTFKTVDQSQREYEQRRKAGLGGQFDPVKSALVINKQPVANGISGGVPSSSAVLAAVGAGMLPATMAMMIPMMLGRRKREIKFDYNNVRFAKVPRQILLRRM